MEYLYLRTQDSQADNPWNASWSIRSSYAQNVQDIVGYRIALFSFEAPNIVYPINQYADKIYFNEDSGATLAATLTTNYYNGTTLATEIATQLTAVSAASGLTRTYTVTYDAVAPAYTLVITSSAGTVQLEEGDYDILDEMGYDRLSLLTAIALSGDAPINVSGTKTVSIVSNLATHSYTTGVSRNVFTRIPVTVNFGEVLFYKGYDDPENYVFVANNQLDEIFMQLQDDKGYPWALPNTAHATYTLHVKPVRNENPHSLR